MSAFFNSKSCNCSIDSFLKKEKVFKIKNGPYELVEGFEFEECPIHQIRIKVFKKYIIKRAKNIVKPLNLNEQELSILRKVIYRMWNSNLQFKVWNGIVSKSTIQKKTNFTESLIQKGIIELHTKIQKNGNEIQSVHLTDYGKLEIKEILNFWLKEEQILKTKTVIEESIQNTNLNNLTDNQQIICNLLFNQLELIEQKSPKWNCGEKIIIPRNSSGPSVYLYISLAFATWFNNWNEKIAINELSYIIYKENFLPFTLKPSRVLSNYIQDMDLILFNLSSLKCVDLGLVKDKITLNIPSIIKSQNKIWKPLYKNGRLIKLGGGGQALVIKVQDEEDGKHYAMKIYQTIEESNHNIERFMREKNILKKLNGNKNIIKLIDYNFFYSSISRIWFYVMELGDITLYSKIMRKLNNYDEIFHYFIQIIDSLGYIHSKKIIHRDLKPKNILISLKNIIKIIDFGISLDKIIKRMTYTGEIVGSMNYIAPELLKGRDDNIDIRADYYSIGKILYFMLSGGKIFPREQYNNPEYSLSILKNNSNFKIFNKFFSRTINENREERYKSFNELKNDFLSCINVFKEKLNTEK